MVVIFLHLGHRCCCLILSHSVPGTVPLTDLFSVWHFSSLKLQCSLLKTTPNSSLFCLKFLNRYPLPFGKGTGSFRIWEPWMSSPDTLSCLCQIPYLFHLFCPYIISEPLHVLASITLSPPFCLSSFQPSPTSFYFLPSSGELTIVISCLLLTLSKL